MGGAILPLIKVFMEKKIDKIIEHIMDIKTEQSRQGVLIDKNTTDLTEHKEGVIQNRCRIRILEEAKQRTAGAVKVITIICAVVASLTGAAVALLNYLR